MPLTDERTNVVEDCGHGPKNRDQLKTNSQNCLLLEFRAICLKSASKEKCERFCWCHLYLFASTAMRQRLGHVQDVFSLQRPKKKTQTSWKSFWNLLGSHPKRSLDTERNRQEKWKNETICFETCLAFHPKKAGTYSTNNRANQIHSKGCSKTQSDALKKKTWDFLENLGNSPDIPQ